MIALLNHLIRRELDASTRDGAIGGVLADAAAGEIFP